MLWVLRSRKHRPWARNECLTPLPQLLCPCYKVYIQTNWLPCPTNNSVQGASDECIGLLSFLTDKTKTETAAKQWRLRFRRSSSRSDSRARRTTHCSTDAPASTPRTRRSSSSRATTRRLSNYGQSVWGNFYEENVSGKCMGEIYKGNILGNVYKENICGNLFWSCMEIIYEQDVWGNAYEENIWGNVWGKCLREMYEENFWWKLCIHNRR